MASTHKIKNPNGDGLLSSQDKSIDIRLPNQGISSPANDNLPSDYKNMSEVPKSIVENREFHGIQHQLDTKQFQNSVLKFDFDDVLITPNAQTNIASRFNGQINPYYDDELGKGRLPLLTAPMDSVVGLKNAHVFQENKINVVLPRTETKTINHTTFSSFGLQDKPSELNGELKYVLLDVANGHMSTVLEWCVSLKKQYPQIKIMAGNIANPQTYKIYCDSGVIDYARVGIGNGNGCLTTQQTGIGYPMGSLIAECYEIKKHHKNPCKIVADGGMKKPSDIIKALALGADYVMLGSVLSKALESSAPTTWKGIRLHPIIANNMYDIGFDLKKKFRGMSTKQAQKAMGKTNIKTSAPTTRGCRCARHQAC